MTKIKFLLSITIIQVRNLNIFDSDTCVILNFNNRTKTTNVHENSDNPFFNEHFSFEFIEREDEMIKKNLQISVNEVKGTYENRKLIGETTISLGMLWNRECISLLLCIKIRMIKNNIFNQLDHAIIDEWVSLEKLNENGNFGFIQLNISILTSGHQPPPLNLNYSIYDDIDFK